MSTEPTVVVQIEFTKKELTDLLKACSIGAEKSAVAFKIKAKAITPFLKKGGLGENSEDQSRERVMGSPSHTLPSCEGGNFVSSPQRKKQKRSPRVGISDWLLSLGEEHAIPEDDPIFAWADKVGLPVDYLYICWRYFERAHRESGKTYKDWRAAFRNCARQNWYRLWWLDGREYKLTTTGRMAEMEIA